MKSPAASRIGIFCMAHARALAIGSAVLLATILAILFYSSTWRTGDDGRYYVLGLSLSEGAGLTQYVNPLQPPEALTPPLYPALIAGVIRTTDHPVIWVKRIGNLLFVLATLMVVLTLMGPQENSRYGWMGACMGMFTVGVASFASFIMSDTLFILLVYASLWISQKAKSRTWHTLAIGCCCGLAYLTRAAGLALMAAVLFDALIHRQWKRLLIAGAGMFLVAAPYLYWKTFIYQGPDPYMAMTARGAQLSQGVGLFIHIPLYVAKELIRDMPEYLFNIIPARFFYAAHKVIGTSGFWRGVAMLVGLCSTAGFFLRVRRWNAMDYFFIFSILLIALLPGTAHQVKYYFFPILPIAAYYLFTFMGWIAGQCKTRLNRRWMGNAILVAAACLFFFSLLLDFTAGMIHFLKENPRRAYAPWAPERFQAFHNEYDDAWARVSESATWIQQNTPTNAVLLSRKPDHLYVMTQRQGWRYEIPSKVQCETIMESVEKFAPEQAVYLLEDAFPAGASLNTYGNNREHVLNETVRKVPDAWQMVYSTPEPVTRVWAYIGAKSVGMEKYMFKDSSRVVD